MKWLHNLIQSVSSPPLQSNSTKPINGKSMFIYLVFSNKTSKFSEKLQLVESIAQRDSNVSKSGLIGRWCLESSDNFEAFLVKIGWSK